MREQDVRLLMEISQERESLDGMMRGVEMQRTKTIKAGALIWCESYPIWDTTRRREAQTELDARKGAKGTRTAQKRLNARRAQERLVQIINANFGRGDLFITCTYASDRQPADVSRANRNMRNYIARLRRLCERRGSPAPAYVYVTESATRKGGRVEYHHHMIIKAEVTREEAERMWEQAGHGHANSRTAKPTREGLIGLAKYMAKQVCSTEAADEATYRHKWCASKGLKVPQATEADKKVSRRRVERIAEAMERDTVEAHAHLERCYPGYEVLEMSVRTSKWITGAYVRAVMVRRE